MVSFWKVEAQALKSEHRHRGMKLGVAPHFPDDWGRELAAGGNRETRTLDLTDVNRAL